MTVGDKLIIDPPRVIFDVSEVNFETPDSDSINIASVFEWLSFKYFCESQSEIKLHLYTMWDIVLVKLPFEQETDLCVVCINLMLSLYIIMWIKMWECIVRILM